MSWLSEITEGIGSFWSGNKDWIKPVAQVGLGALKQTNKDDSQSQYLEYLKQRENANYQTSVDSINAYNAQMLAASMAGGGGGSSGGGGDGGAAAAAAARATEANRQKAAKKANKFTQKTYKDLLKMYQPYRETADTLLPQMTGTYQNSLGLQNSLATYLNSPAQIAKLDASVPAWQVNVPLPEAVRMK